MLYGLFHSREYPFPMFLFFFWYWIGPCVLHDPARAESLVNDVKALFSVLSCPKTSILLPGLIHLYVVLLPFP